MEIKTIIIKSTSSKFCVIIIIKKRHSAHIIYTIYTWYLVMVIELEHDEQSFIKWVWQWAVGNDTLHLTQTVASFWIMSVLSLVLSSKWNEISVQGRMDRCSFCSSCWGLNGGFNLGGCSLLFPRPIFADKGAVLVELDILVAVVHQAVPALRGFDLPAQGMLAALQRLLVVVAAREEQWI